MRRIAGRPDDVVEGAVAGRIVGGRAREQLVPGGKGGLRALDRDRQGRVVADDEAARLGAGDGRARFAPLSSGSGPVGFRSRRSSVSASTAAPSPPLGRLLDEAALGDFERDVAPGLQLGLEFVAEAAELVPPRLDGRTASGLAGSSP